MKQDPLSRIPGLLARLDRARSWMIEPSGRGFELRMIHDDAHDIAFLGPAEHEALLAALDRRAAVVSDPVLGAVRWDAVARTFSGQVGDVEVNVAVDLDAPEEAIHRAGEAVTRVLANRDRLLDNVVIEAAKIYNSGDWGPRLTDAEFRARLRLRSVWLNPRDDDDDDPVRVSFATTVVFDADDLFAGHEIGAHIDEDGTVTDVEI